MNQDKYVNLVDQLLAGNGNKDKIMKEIDEFVYELYGLTEKEIKMIENN